MSTFLEMTRGIGHLYRTQTIPVWVTFGLQMLLDIQDVMGSSVDKAVKDVQAHARYAQSTNLEDLAI